MNSEQERPFVCSAPGCSQRFPTEDHLMIHRHKHEMTLKFPSIKNDNMLSDQTPTPTRFLKNCEEVGLFTELEFCKAQEEEDNKQNITLHGQSGPNQHQQQPHPRMANHDTSIVIQQALPSPQSSSVITQAPSTNRQIGPVPGSLSSLLHLHNRQRQPLPASMPGPLPDPTMPSSSAVLMPMERQMSMGSNMMGMQGPAHTNSCSSPHVPSMHSEAKLRLKAALAHHPGAIANGNMNTMGHMMEMMSSRQEQLSPAAQQMQPTQTLQSPPPTGGRRRRVVDEDPDERRRKFLERNRAAATRCRQKRKVWVMSLEKKAEELTQTNMQLQNEVTMLKNEVTQLKQLLLTHKDCPITAMQKESQGYLSPENSPVGSPGSVGQQQQQQVIQHNTITTSSNTPNHRVDINPIH
ncbi:cyclic AMP-responsive element-binding protein 5 isoform X3 [Denticeps clupeoides]|uniref:cyclic AMP-responsive element-binding protein 5 isoform X3 n=1 Tax=Denticeps clupeoides TaxID=299321 RepID=UPI0010A4FC41|nr:cyclic AMP-responsive element-binding protein 5 isoform X3 [Denticeps clupeoides]